MSARLRRSIAYSALDSYLGLVLQVASTVIVARLLTPEQSGTFAVAAAFAAVASTFRDFGVAEYLIQEKELDTTALRAALAVNIAASWAMAAAMLAGSYAAAHFYQSQGVGEVMRVQALSLVLIPFGAVTLAWFRREMDFRHIFVANALANLVSFAVVLTLAWQGWGYMSLAWASFAGVLVTVATAACLRPPHVPLLPGWRGLGRVLKFGKFATGIYLFGQLGKGAPDVVIGKALDLTSVGLFSRAGGLVEIFNRVVLRALTPIYLPFFAQAIREHGSPRIGLMTALSYTSVVGWPFFTLTGLIAAELIALMYGPQWAAAAPLARVLCIAAALELAYGSVKEALLAAGKPEVASRLQLLTQILRVVCLLLSVPWGLMAASWGLTVGSLFGASLAHHALIRHLGLSQRDVLRSLAPSMALTALMGAVLLLAHLALMSRPPHAAVHVLALGSLAVAAWLTLLWAFKHPLSAELGRLLARGRAAAPGANRRR